MIIRSLPIVLRAALFATLEMKTLPATIAAAGIASAVTWAEEKIGVPGAYARLAVMGALMHCRPGAC